MIVRTLIAAAILTATAHAASDFERTLNVNSAPDLYVSTNSGHIKIVPGSDSQIHIKAHLTAGWNSGDDLQARIDRIVANPPVQQSGNSVHVGEVSPEDRRLFNNITIDYEISAPKGVALNLHSGSGDVEVDNVGRFLKADTGSGSVRAHGIAGPSDLHTGSGDLEVQQTAAGDVRTATGSGSIRIHGLAGSLTAKTGSGDIEADGSLTGSSRLQSGSGSVRLHIGKDAHFNVNATTGSGDIRVAGTNDSEKHHFSGPINGGGPSLEVITGSGDIEVN